MLKKLNQILHSSVPPQKISDNLDMTIEEVAYLKTMKLEIKKKHLSPQESIQMTMHVLRTIALDDTLAPVILQAWDEIKDDDGLFIEAIIAVGLIVNLTLFMATSDIEFKAGGLSIRKGRADAQTIKTLVEPITEMVKKIPHQM